MNGLHDCQKLESAQNVNQPIGIKREKPMGWRRKPLFCRFSSKYEISENGCWNWIGAKDKLGYGEIMDSSTRKPIPSHRMSWTIFKGEIPLGIFVLHKCDNPSCVNPNHLFLGTQKDNVQDMIKKKRVSCGTNRYNSKLSNDNVSYILKSNLFNYQLAKIFNIDRSTISRIKNNLRWRFHPGREVFYGNNSVQE